MSRIKAGIQATRTMRIAAQPVSICRLAVDGLMLWSFRSILVLVLVGIVGLVPAAGQTGSVENVSTIPKNSLEKKLHSEILCTCGCRRALDNCGMPNCAGHSAQAAKISALVAAGQTHDAIIAAFVRDFGGQDILIEPADKTLSRFLWMFPFGLAASCLTVILLAMKRWSLRPKVDAPTGVTSAEDDSGELKARLDRELEHFD